MAGGAKGVVICMDEGSHSWRGDIVLLLLFLAAAAELQDVGIKSKWVIN